MKLATFSHDGRARIGLVEGSSVIDVTAGRSGLPEEMKGLIEAGPEALEAAKRLAASAPHIPLAHVKLHAPIARPGKIMALGKNYADHAAEMGGKAPDHMMWFSKAQTSVNGPYDPIPLPPVTGFVDYEVELVAVIGLRTKGVSADDALSAVFGYMVGNDVSARDWQRRTSQYVIGKSFDGHAPIGPWITTAEDVADPQALSIGCSINGETRQAGHTSDMIFSIADQIAELSQVMTLEPGDLIFSGTPSGVGAGMDPPQALKDGDVVRCEIEGLGVLEATCQATA
ncbi:MAG: fumarylacetoacetate hydrolase family protein [Pseudomonadota bacterium]